MSTVIEMMPVASKAIAAIGYEASTQTMHVQFHASRTNPLGARWTYAPISQDEFDHQLATGESFGSWIASVKKNPAITALPFAESAEEPE